MTNNVIKGVKYYRARKTFDDRGFFCKSDTGGDSLIKVSETFFSFSKKRTIRGMHLQIGEYANDRLITVISGRVFDVLVDLRNNGEPYRSISVQEMSSDGFGTVFVPKGVAHGFQALEDSMIHYISSSTYSKEFDIGININSFDINWPLLDPIMSIRDHSLPHLSTIDLF